MVFNSGKVQFTHNLNKVLLKQVKQSKARFCRHIVWQTLYKDPQVELPYRVLLRLVFRIYQVLQDLGKKTTDHWSVGSSVCFMMLLQAWGNSTFTRKSFYKQSNFRIIILKSHLSLRRKNHPMVYDLEQYI